MKKFIFVLLICIIYSCSNTCKENDVVKNRFNYYLNSINNYDLHRGEITDSLLANFVFSAEVLSDLTGEKYSYFESGLLSIKKERIVCLILRNIKNGTIKINVTLLLKN